MNKKYWLSLWLWGLGHCAEAQIPVALLIKEGIQKAVVAMDLKIQKLQTRTIWLQNAQKIMENTLSQLKLEEISGWIQKQKDLYQQYFDELWRVKNAVAFSHEVGETAALETTLVKEGEAAWNGVSQDPHFSTGERLYIREVYSGILSRSLDHLNRLDGILSPYSTQMSDAGRLEIVDQVKRAIQENYHDLEEFNQENIQVSLHRAKDQNEIQLINKLYGLP
ncbi:MAG: conjugal transfer protein TraI [Bacteroidota bacterium]|nr:conjugal transfer protein TraI [Bacteroidota bacterium]